MKYLTSKNLFSLLLFITCVIASSCIDNLKNKNIEPTERAKPKVDSTIIATTQLTDSRVGYFVMK